MAWIYKYRLLWLSFGECFFFFFNNFISFLFLDSQKEPQKVTQNTNLTMRKTKSAAELINKNRTSLGQASNREQDLENMAPKVKATKKELVTAKPKVHEIATAAKPPVVLRNEEHGQLFEQLTNGKENSETQTMSQVQCYPGNFISLSQSRISPLSSNSAENEVKIEEERERKTKVRFNTDTVCPKRMGNIDLSETQSAMESVTSCDGNEQRKENFHPGVR